MKKLLALVLALVLVCAMSVASAEVVLQLAETHAEGYPTTLADREFARLVEERTEGRVKIEVYSGSQLADGETTAIEKLQSGDIAFTRVSASPVGSYVPSINAIQLPYLYKNADHMWAVLDGEIGQTMLAGIQESGSGLIGLCYYEAGARSFYITQAAYEKANFAEADLTGLKIRMQNNPMMVRMIDLLGGTGVTGIGANEVYSSIQTGVVDGAENNWPTYQNMSDYEAAPVYVLDEHTRVPEILLMSEFVAENILSEEDVAIIKECAKETQQYERDRWAEKEESAEKIIRESGCTVVEVDAETKAKYEAKMAPLYEEYGADYTDIIDAIKAVGEGF